MKSWLLFILLPLNAFSQSIAFHFTNIGVDQGLSQSSVYGIMQDKQGFLWIGTGDGLNRYDGKSFKIYRNNKDDSSGHSLPGTIINSMILEDRFERLWFNTNKGLVMMDKKCEKFSLIRQTEDMSLHWEPEFRPFGISKSDTLWGTVSQIGLVALNINTHRAKEYPYPDNSRNLLTRFSAVLSGHFIWIICSEGLLCFDTRTHVYRKVLSGHSFSNIYQLQNGRLVIGGKEKISVFDPSTFHTQVMPVASGVLGGIYWSSFCEGPFQVLYTGSEGAGIAVINPLTGRRTNLRNAATKNPTATINHFINCLFIDRSKNLWIGTEGSGLYRLDLKPQKFHKFPPDNSVVSNMMVKSVFKDNQNNIWVGTFSKGLYVINPRTGNYKRYSFPHPRSGISEPIYFIYKDSSNRIWMNAGGRVGYINPFTFRFKQSIFLQSSGVSEQAPLTAMTMKEMTKDHFWVGTNDGIYFITVSAEGAIVVDPSRPTSISPSISGLIYALGKGKDGSAYIGKVRGGFWRRRIEGEEITTIDSAFINSGIRDFYFLRNHSLVWIATEDGLAVYDPKRKQYHLFNERQGMSDHYVYGILAENDSSLWVSTNKGINHAIVSYTPDNKIKNIHFTAYTSTDGLQSNEFNSGAFYRAQDGEMIFGGVYGINWFRPSAVITNYFKPKTVITSVEVNDQPFKSDTASNYLHGISLPYNHNRLTFKFAALEFTNPATNRFAYILEGIEQNWVSSGSINEVRYANLPPGKYTFKVKTSNNDGIWNENPAGLSIIIHPPFWGTWWFRTAVTILLVVILVTTTRMIAQRRLKARVTRLEQEQALNRERERISREMHDDIGAGLTQITLMSEAIQRQIEKKDRQKVEEIALTGRRLINNISEIIWSMNPENNTLQQLLAYLREQLNKLLEYSTIDYELKFPDAAGLIVITNQYRRNILMVCKEIVNNAIKHSGAKRIVVKVTCNHHALHFEIKDNGKGMALESAHRGNGMSNIQKRIKELDGKLHITSEKGKGTGFYFTTPLPSTT